jgi:hypothetical protein
MAVMMVLTSKRVEKRSGATPAAFPPPIFTGIAHVSVFCYSLPPLDRDHQGGLYIGVFRSGWASGRKDGRHQRPELQTRLDGVLGLGPMPLGLFWALGLLPLTSCDPGASRGKILTLQKSWVNLSPGSSLKNKNMQNRVFLSCRVITKIRRIDGKSP